MTITLNPTDYSTNRDAVMDCLRGEFCKIQRVTDTVSGEMSYTLCADVTIGWETNNGYAFHATETDGSIIKAGLGVFFLIKKTDTLDGGCTLEFTKDLNPDAT